jgi:hypothetical protein
MKKILLLLLIPVTIVSVYALINVKAGNINTETDLGNGLTNTTFDSNTYIELLEEDSNKQYDITIPEEFELVASDDDLELYLEEETLAIAVRVKANGYVYSSYNFNDSFSSKSEGYTNPIKSGVTLELYNGTTPSTSTYLDSKKPLGMPEELRVATSRIISQENGFTAKVDFNHPEINIRFDLTVTIEDGTLNVSIPGSSIEEYNKGAWGPEINYYMLRNIIVFPYFGSNKGVDDGYVLVPDGSGALIGLENNPETKSSFKIDIYGEDLGYVTQTFVERSFSQKAVERISIPLFGMILDAGKTGFYVVASEGSNYAQLNFKSKDVINDYYYTYFGFRYRQSYEQYQSRSNEDQHRISFQDEINEYDVALEYSFLAGLEADYVGIAKSYQNDLVEAGVLSDNHRNDFTQTPTKIDFIGAEIEEGILSTRITEITKYNEMVTIIKQLQNDGYKEITTSLKTYTKEEEGYRFDLYRELGGKSDFKEMLTFMEENDIDFSYYLDYVRSYKDYSTGHAQTLSRREISHLEMSRMYNRHLVNDTRLYMDYAVDDVLSFDKYGINNVAFSGLDRAIYTSYDSGVVYSTRNMTEVNAMLAFFNQHDISTGIYEPDAYMYKYVDAYYNAPISSSDYAISIASVPFVQLVLGGYVDMYSEYLNFASDETTTLLRLVEYGVFPSYIFTGGTTYELKLTNSSQVYISQYDILQNRISDYYDKINAGLTATINQEMVNHQFVDEGVVLVTYEDNTQILINYNEESYTYNTVTVDASSYEVIR